MLDVEKVEDNTVVVAPVTEGIEAVSETGALKKSAAVQELTAVKEPAVAQKPATVEEPAPAQELAAEAAPVKEEPRKTGYRSELDGVGVEFELQYREQETDMEDIARRVTEDYARRGNDVSAIELIQVYLKPTDYTAYYVINNSYEGKIPLF